MNRHLIKILCLLAAVVIWIQVASSRLLTRDVELPLELVNVPPGATLEGNDWPPSVQVRATGTKWQFFLDQYLGRDLGVVVVDLSGVRADVVWQRDVTVNDVESPLSDIAVNPPVTLSLELDTLGETVLPVAPALTGRLPENRLLVEPVAAKPGSVIVRGPSRKLRDLPVNVTTDPLDLARLRGSQEIWRDLQSPVPGLELDPGRVRLVYTVSEARRRSFEHVPVVPLIDADHPGADIFPPVLTVEVRGPVARLDGMAMSDISLTVPLSGLEPGTHTLTPEVILPEHVELLALEPAEVLVIVGGAGDDD